MLRFLLISGLLFCGVVLGGGPVRVGFYNAENLFDTVRNPLADDGEYTPGGALRWTGDRYRAKVGNIAAVLDSMSLDMVGLCEVENEQVVRDLVTRMATDYNYIHRTSSDFRGIDVVLLYKGDKFHAELCRLIDWGGGREFLHVRGLLCGVGVNVIVCHLPSHLSGSGAYGRAFTALMHVTDSLKRVDRGRRMIVMGDMNAGPRERQFRKAFPRGMRVAGGAGILFNPFYVLAGQGYGSYLYRGRWELLDQILIDGDMLGGGGLRYDDCGVFIRRWMLAPADSPWHGYPLRTFRSGVYEGGYSDHLPVFVTLSTGN